MRPLTYPAANPVPAFSGQPLDRADHVRMDPEALQDLRRDGRLLRLDGLVPQLEQDALTWDPVPAGDAELIFLGLLDGQAMFAAVPEQGDADPAYTRRQIWAALGMLSPADLTLYGTARSVLDWHARHRFCSRCGSPTGIAKGGWMRECPACQTEHYPRVDPVAIMLVEHQGRLLLGRQAAFPAGSYSALAGFVEPGETIEATVAREVFEETGVRVREVRYIASQPWPFPSQLMLGCHSLAQDDALAIDPRELEDARWFSRDQVAEALDRGKDSTSFIPPPAQAIAHDLLAWWLENRS